jgi:hypothetical protein
LILFEKEKLKERELREQMERELRIKEQQLSEVTKKQSDLEMKFLRLNLNESETKNENERLQKVDRTILSRMFYMNYFFFRKNLYLKNNYKILREILKNRKTIYHNYKFKQRKKNEIEQSISQEKMDF